MLEGDLALKVLTLFGQVVESVWMIRVLVSLDDRQLQPEEVSRFVAGANSPYLRHTTRLGSWRRSLASAELRTRKRMEE